ncbi:hypothetical protein [Dyadobacter arcticus]|uniref:YceI family protein n=1 Tax=Dyadobacter arcticus TaxID=1078754 RepID=A0ABX0UH59_9BACT|nr:hypothetical protein [Dyadobacter arcticus]NIJ52352.1 hypothetical protein [Dyadobacter arcticus]
MKTRTFEVASVQSNIDWTGKKVTGAHHGTIGDTLIYNEFELDVKLTASATL